MTAATLLHSGGGAPAVPLGDSLKYQLTVVAPTVLDAVSRSGGWLFDRVMAGWDVNVLIPGPWEPVDIRPLAILGARVFDLETALRSAGGDYRPQALAVDVDAFERDQRIGREVLSALRRTSTEVTFWGSDVPPHLDRAVSAVEYSLTAAARAFKGQALTLTCGRPVPVERTERFFAGTNGYLG